MSEDRILALFDFHVPFNIPLDPIWEFAEDFKPTILILGGDLHDWGAVSEWVADQSRHLDAGTITDNYRELRKTVLDPARKATKGARKIFLVGNHEDWIRKACNASPNYRGFIELENNIDLDKYNMTLVPLNQAYHVNSNLCYLHGLYMWKYHAYATVHAVHKSVLYGHTHDVQRYTDVSPVDVKKFYTGASCGCLCTLNPAYMKNRPNRWVNGFNFAYVDRKTEEFSETQVYIIRNKFWALGRRYK